MEKTPAEVVQRLDREIEQCAAAIQARGREARARLETVDLAKLQTLLPRMPDGTLDEAAWSARDPAEQDQKRALLENACDALRIAARLDGPIERNHLMADEYASTGACVGWLIIVMVLSSALLGLIVAFWPRATGADYTGAIVAAAKAQDEAIEATNAAARARSSVADLESGVALAPTASAVEPAAASGATTSGAADSGAPRGGDRVAAAKAEADKLLRVAANKTEAAQRAAVEAVQAIRKAGPLEQWVLAMVMLLGALGGALHFLGSLVKFLGNRQLKRSWLPYYLAMPFTGAGLALIVYMLLRVGIVSPPTGAVASVSNLNLIVIYAFSVLSGLFSKAATEKLGEVFSTVFRTSAPASKDPVGAESPRGPGAP